MDQSEIMHLLSRQVSAMEGGRKRRVGRPRKKRGRGMDGIDAMDEMMMEGGRHPLHHLHHLHHGGALVGGKRKKKMPPELMAYFASKRKTKKRGRGLVGGSTAQEIYEKYAEEGRPIPDNVMKLLKLGVHPLTPKQLLVKRVQAIEKKYGLKVSPTEALKKYTTATLQKLLQVYKANPEFAYPPMSKFRDEYDDEDRLEDADYVPLVFAEQVEEEPRRARRTGAPSATSAF